MALLNNYNLYAYNLNNSLSTTDEVEKHIEFLKGCDDYEEVKSYLEKHFGEIDGEQWVDFEKCHKECYLNFEDGKIEFCSLKNNKQYYGKGWIKIQND